MTSIKAFLKSLINNIFATKRLQPVVIKIHQVEDAVERFSSVSESNEIIDYLPMNSVAVNVDGLAF